MTEIRGDGSAGRIGGVPNRANITMPWRCSWVDLEPCSRRQPNRTNRLTDIRRV